MISESQSWVFKRLQPPVPHVPELPHPAGEQLPVLQDPQPIMILFFMD
jgi:hypothetical protein